MSGATIHQDLRGKRVVVTGAGRGIGQAIAEAFLTAGSRVAVVARDDVSWLDGHMGAEVDVIRCDIRDPAPLQAWLDRLERDGGGVDIVVNNAGHIVKCALIDCPEGDFDAVFSVNTRATFFLSQMFARHMRRRGGGVIVCTGSYAATLASLDYGVYAASKAALASLTRSMAAEWAPFGIRVNAISPGVIPTRMTAPALETNEARMLEQISLRRVGAPEEVAAVALFLASDASSYMTGADIDVSGGKLIIQNPGAAWRA